MMFQKNDWVLAVAVLAFLASCTKNRDDRDSSLEQALSELGEPGTADSAINSDIQPIMCQSGEAFAFTLASPENFQPSAANVKLNKNLPWQLQKPQPNSNIRLDACVDGENATLKRVVVREGVNSPQWTAESKDIISAQGLNKALFGDHSGLEIRISQKEIGRGLLIKGWQQDNHSFATAVPVGFADDGTYEVYSMSFPAGIISLGDPWGKSPCKRDQEYLTSQFAYGSARFWADVCTFKAGGHTTGYRVHKLSVQDSSARLEASAQKEFTFSGDELPRVLRVKWNHHNACDSFVLTLPHATYAATLSPAAGCGEILPDAPQRNLQDEDGTVHYRVKYGSSPWSKTEKAAACNGIIYGCNER